MVVDTTKESVCVNQIVGQKNVGLIIEGDVIVPDIKPDVLTAVKVSGNVCIYKKEVLDGKIRLDGCIQTYIMYIADNETGDLRGINTNLDFTQVIDVDNCRAGMDLGCKLKIKSIEANVLNSRKLALKALIDAEIKVYSNSNIDIIKEINSNCCLQKLSNTIDVNSLVGYGTTKAYAKETISIDEIDNLAEILKVDMDMINRDTKISYNKVLVKTDARVRIMYLTEDNRIKNIVTRIPVMGFIDIENINDNNICNVDYSIKNLIIKPNNADNHSIYVESEIEIVCFAYESKNINLIEDLYGISSDLSFTQREIDTMADKHNIKEICELREQISIPEIGENKLYSVQTNPNISNVNIRNGKIIYEGELNLEFLYDLANSINSRTAQIPFNFEVSSDNINENCEIDTNIDIKKDDFILNQGNIDTNIQLEFNISTSRTEKLNIINEISSEESKDNNVYSMVIYFVKPGDTVWKIAKKFKSTMEDIASVNNIEDINKIYPGQQLYIPKFIKNNIAV